MTRWILPLTFLLAGCASGPHADFGEPMKLTGEADLSITDVLADPSAHDGAYVRLEGPIHSVCARRGCWLRLGESGSEQTIFVKFTCPIAGRLIPMEAEGRQALVEGQLKVETISQADARHFAEDAGKSREEIEAIVGDQVQVRMAAPSARVFGIEQPPEPEPAPTSRPKDAPAVGQLQVRHTPGAGTPA